MELSFCTTCKDRRVDLERTLPANLRFVRAGRDEVVLLDYNSRDGLRRWVKDNFGRFLRADRLRLYSETSALRFFMAHAKNVSHLVARGRVLVNLDADNFLDERYLDVLRNASWSTLAMLYPNPTVPGGHRGRVAVRADVFRAAGGYDERMDRGYGYEEVDLMRRVKAAGHRVVNVYVDPTTAIPTDPLRKAEGQADPGVPIRVSNKMHQIMSDENLRAGRLVANLGAPWGVAELLDQRGDVVRCHGCYQSPQPPADEGEKIS